MRLRALMESPARGLTAQDLQSLAGHLHAHAPVLRDGVHVGEGEAGLSRLWRDECDRNGRLAERVAELDGTPVLVGWGGTERHPQVKAVWRIMAFEDRVSELRVDHDPDILARADAASAST